MKRLVPVIFLLLAGTLQAQDDAKRWKSISRRLKEGTGEEKFSAVREAAGFDTSESAGLVVKVWLEIDRQEREWIKAGMNVMDADGRVVPVQVVRNPIRDRIQLTIGSYTDANAIRHLASQMRTSPSEGLREVIAAAAWRYGKPVVETLRGVLREERSPVVLRSALDSIATLKAADGAGEVLPLLSHVHRKVRLGAIRAAQVLDLAKAIPILIDQLECDGLLATEITDALITLTGENMGHGASEWKRWWGEKGAAFLEAPPSMAERRPAIERARKHCDTVATFYGIPVLSKRAIFIIDCSASMSEDGKMRRATTEVKDAVNRMAANSTFDVLAFNSDVHEMNAQMISMSETTRQGAADWLDGLDADGGTNVNSALLRGLEIATRDGKLMADTVYFVSDGRPTGGVSAAYTLAKVREKNPDAKIIIHTVCVGHDADHEFMQTLALQNEGTHHDR